MCKHTLTTNAERKNRVDPTKTKSIVKKYEKDLVRRFKQLQREIKQAIEIDDVFGLKPVTRFVGNESLNKRQFEFKSNPDKINAFMFWLKSQVDSGILGIQKGQESESVRSRAWSDVYIESAYDRGVRQSALNMKKAGAKISDRFISAAFNRPIHADSAGIIYTRAFSDLQGITKAMDTRISRALSSGIIEGLGARDLAASLNNQVKKIGITRARVLARTEIIAAHAEATLNSYQEAGLEGVKVNVEFSTAGDDDVCPDCQSLEGKILGIAEARGVIPVHPNCRCAFLPAIDDLSGIELF